LISLSHFDCVKDYKVREKEKERNGGRKREGGRHKD
jgi:hypothetical protein